MEQAELRDQANLSKIGALEKENAEVRQERDEYRNAFLELQARLDQINHGQVAQNE